MKIAVTQRFDLGKYKAGEWLISKNNKEMFERKNVFLIQVNNTLNIDEVVNMCDGLFVPGGADVNPKLYGEEINGSVNIVDEMDELDYAYIKAFNEAGKPIMGICRGHQIINVYFGGTLHQDITNHKDGVHHKVDVTKRSFIDEMYHQEKLTVNSFHHQAIKDLAPGFEICAKSEDGYIEAIQKDNIYSVQWHPEMEDPTEFINYFVDKVFKN